MRITYPRAHNLSILAQRVWQGTKDLARERTPRATSEEGAGGPDGATESRRIKVAHNFPRSVFKRRSKRCNSNDVNSRFEAAAGELRATLPRNHACDRPRGPDLSSSVHVKDWVSACVTVTDDEPRSRCTANGTPATQPTETPAAQPQEHRRHSQRNTGGAAATRVCERPGGESLPPGLYARITCR